MKYYTDYPREKISEKNPYYCCSYCKVSDPEINGQLKNHEEWCQYRKFKELEEENELLKLEIDVLRLELSENKTTPTGKAS
jgi:hypothetical protein